jgi:hypothetical protein
MEALFAVTAVVSILSAFGVTPNVSSAIPHPAPVAEAAPAPAPVVPPVIYTHDPAYRGCTMQNPCWVNQ